MGFIQKIIVLMFVTQNIFAFAGAISGGISGGGGFVINPKKPTYIQSPSQIEHMIKESQTLVKAYVLKKKNQLAQGTLAKNEKEIIAKLFSHPELNIENAILNVPIHIEDEEPCYSAEGLPVDGSIYSEHAGTICISSKMIAEKVTYHQVEKQSAALSLHEFSEVIGFSEAEAIILQMNALVEMP